MQFNTGLWMLKTELLGVQHEAFGFVAYHIVGIQRIAKDRVSYCLQVHTQLVTAAGFRFQDDAAGVVLRIIIHDFIVCPCRFAGVVIDDLPGPVRPVSNQRQVNTTFSLNRLSGDNCQVTFLDLSSFK